MPPKAANVAATRTSETTPVSGPGVGDGSLTVETRVGSTGKDQFHYPFSDTDDSADDLTSSADPSRHSSRTEKGASLSSPSHKKYLDVEGEYDSDGGDAETAERGNEENLANEQAIMSGFLKKKGEQRRTWKKRWFVLRPTAISYYKNEKEYELLAIIRLSEVQAIAEVELKKRQNVFGLVTKNRTFYMQATSHEEMESWLVCIKGAHREIARNTSPKPRSNSVSMGRLPSATYGHGTSEGSLPTGSFPKGILVRDSEANEHFSSSRKSATRDSDAHSPKQGGTTAFTESPTRGTRAESIEDPSDQGSIATTNESLLTVATTPSMMLANIHTSNLTPQVASSSTPRSSHPTSAKQSDTPIPPILHADTTRETIPRSSQANRHPHFSPATAAAGSRSPEAHSPEGSSSSPPQGRRSENTVMSSSEEDDGEEEGNAYRDGDRVADDRVVQQGYLEKQGTKYAKAWKKRWFVLRNRRLTCYKNEDEYVVRRIIPLRIVLDVFTVDPPSKGHVHCFKIVLPKRHLILCAASEEECEQWVACLKEELANDGGESM